VREAGGHVREAALMLEGITCAACVWLNEHHLARLPGVLAVDINYATHRARVRWDAQRIALSDILAAVAAIGYRAHPYDSRRSEEARRRERRLALWRLFIAGFGMMQVMMYLVPVYLTAGEMTPDIEQLMRVASLVLTLPVVLYSAAPFFTAAWRDLRARRVGMDVPVALGIGAAFVASVYATLRAEGQVYFDSITMFVFLLLGARFLEMTARARASEAQERLVKALPALAEKLAGWPGSDVGEEVPVSTLMPGDFLRVRPGAAVPTDGEVVAGESEVSEALITGEAQPLPRRAGDAVVGGSVNVSGPLVLRVTRVGEDTVLAAILRLLDHATADKPRLAQLADRVAQWFVAALLAIAAVVAVVWYVIDPGRALWVTVAVLVVSCPCALSLATPAALTAATGALYGRGVLVTRGHALETIARATHFVLDKTGTLTEGRQRLAGVIPLAAITDEEALRLAAAVERASEHPLARALCAAVPGGVHAAHDVRNVPGQGIEATVDGRRLRAGRPEFVAALHGQALPGELAGIGDDVSVVALGVEHGWLALFTFADPLRATARQTVAELHAAGVQVCLLSGDRQEVVARRAAELGIRDWRGGATPSDKVDYVSALQDRGAVVVMVGDGVNDAAVLARAQASMAMGGGADIANISADVVLMGSRIESVVDTLRAARGTVRIVRQNLVWAFVYNVVAIPLAAAGFVTPLLAGAGMALSSLAVVANAMRLLRPGWRGAPQPRA
jgi:Cu2+-exporting ATPase